MPSHRFSGMALATAYAFVAAILFLVLPQLQILTVPLTIFATLALLAGAYTVDLKKVKAKRFAFAAISRGCLTLMLLMGGGLAYEWTQRGFSDVVLLLMFVVLFMAYLTGLALESRAEWLATKET